MRAAVVSEFGGPEVLKVAEVPTPTPGSGQVRVRVKAAGAQGFDTAVRQGWTPPVQTVELPQILGNDFAGIIDEVGDGVADFAVGDEVLGWAVLSCYAEYLVVAADQIVAKALEHAASAQTAHTALQALKVGEGDTVLIHAAASGVGTVTVQLAKEWGATVIGTASERNHDYLHELGALPVTYGDGLADRIRALAPGGVTAALDGAGGVAADVSVELVEDRDRIGTLVEFERFKELGIQAIFSQRSAGRLAELTSLYAQGKLRIEVSRTFPLDGAGDAHREVESGHVRGKVVLEIG